MNFDDTHNEYSDSVDASSDARMCPYCNERPLAKRKDAKTCDNGECKKERIRELDRVRYARPDVKARVRKYCQRPEVKNKMKEYRQRSDIQQRDRESRRLYNQRPEVKERHRKAQYERSQRPEVKAQKKEYEQRPDVKEKHRLSECKRRQRADVKAQYQAYFQRDDVKSRIYQYRQRPEIKERMRVSLRKHRQRPEIKEKLKKDAQSRHRPYPRGYGGPRKRWADQQEHCALGYSDFDGAPWSLVSKYMETDHLVPVHLLSQIGIVDKRVVNTLDNLWVIHWEKNRGFNGKSDKPLHVWLSEIGEPDPVVDMGRQWYEHTVGLIVQAQQAIDPAFVLTDEKKRILGLDK